MDSNQLHSHAKALLEEALDGIFKQLQEEYRATGDVSPALNAQLDDATDRLAVVITTQITHAAIADTEPGGRQFEDLRTALEMSTGEDYSDEAVIQHVESAGGWNAFDDTTDYSAESERRTFSAMEGGAGE